MISVVIDTNVIVSALLFGGNPGKLIDLWIENKIQPIASSEIIDEYLRVLAYPKFSLTEDEIGYLLYKQILPYFRIVKIRSRPTIVQLNPSDDKFIWCAHSAKVKVIISGDEHLLSLKSYNDISIITISAFLKSFQKGEI